jgi:hypothetical protein
MKHNILCRQSRNQRFRKKHTVSISALKMETLCLSETLDSTYNFTLHHNAEQNLRVQRSELVAVGGLVVIVIANGPVFRVFKLGRGR